MYAKGDGPFSIVLSNDDDAYISLDARLKTHPTESFQYQFGAFSCSREFYSKHIMTRSRLCGPCGEPPVNDEYCGKVLEVDGVELQRWDVPEGGMGGDGFELSGKFPMTESADGVLVMAVRLPQCPSEHHCAYIVGVPQHLDAPNP